MEIFDPSSVNVNFNNVNFVESGNGNNSTELNLDNGELILTPEMLDIKDNDYLINVNGLTVYIDNLNEPGSNNESYTLSDGAIVKPLPTASSWNNPFGWIYRINIKQGYYNAMEQFLNSHELFTIKYTLEYEPAQLTSFHQRFIVEKEDSIFRTDSQTTAPGDGRTDILYVSKNNPRPSLKLFAIGVPSGKFFSAPSMFLNGNITITARTIAVRSLLRIVGSSNTNDDSNGMIEFGNNDTKVKIYNNGTISSNNLSLESQNLGLNIDNQDISFKFFGDEVFKVGSDLSIREKATCTINYNLNYIPDSSNDLEPQYRLELNKNGKLIKSSIVKGIIDILDQKANLVKSNGIQSCKIENGILEIYLDNFYNITFPHIQFHSSSNSAMLKIISDLVPPVNKVLIGSNSIFENGRLYLKLE